MGNRRSADFDKQNQAARIVIDSRYDAHTEQLVKAVGWLTIKQLIDTETTKIVYTALQNETTEYIKGLLRRLSDTYSRVLRNSEIDIHVPLLKTSLEQKIFAYRGKCIRKNLSNEGKTPSHFTVLMLNQKIEGILQQSHDVLFGTTFFSFIHCTVHLTLIYSIIHVIKF